MLGLQPENGHPKRLPAAAVPLELGGDRHENPPPSLAMNSDPLQFGRYQIEEQLGEGGMGQTFRATQTGPEGFKKTVVIKLVRPMLKPRFGQMERFIERFRDEARIHSRLDHGNIVHLLDFGVQDGRYFIVMEYVRGMDLRELQTYAGLKGGPLPHAWVEYILDRICRALQVAHTLTSMASRSNSSIATSRSRTCS